MSERDIIGFKRGRTSYEVGVDNTVTQVTVSATANDAAATVAFAPPDADVATGHQVDLSAGRNLVTVTVTAPEGDTQDHTVSVNQGVTDAAGWQAGADLDGLIAAGNNDPYGIWSDGATMWVGDRYDDKLYAYNLSDGTPDGGRDITLDGTNDGPSGVWSDGMTIWVADIADSKVYAYRLSDGMRQPDRDINGLFAAGNSTPEGIWSDRTTMWVADHFDEKVYAYRLSDGMRQPDRDFETSSNFSPLGIWSDGTTMWVADQRYQEVYSYRLSDGTRDVDRDYDINTLAASGLHDSRDIWSNGRTMWVVNATDRKINAYNMPNGVRFGELSYTVDEGGAVEVSVFLRIALDRDVVIPIDATDEGGASSDDYSLSETSVTFGPTETSKTFTFTAADDAEDDDGESVKLTFGSALPAGVSRGSVPETVVSINDDDVPSVTVSFGSATYPVDEGETETVTVTLSAAPEREVVVPIDTTDEGGASSDDYSLSETSVTFGPTETSKTFTFTAADDAEDDDGESVKLTFGSALPAGVSRGSVPETTVSINDDDAPSSLTVNFEASTYNVTEGSTVEVVLTLDDDPERTVTIPFSKTNQGGASDSDYVGVPTSVIFNAGEISKSFEFSAVSDRIGDPGEKVSFKLETLPPGTTAGTTSETVVTIEDVAPQGSTTVSFGADTYGVSEGSFTTITVVMSHAPGSDATIPIMATNQGDTSNSDYLLSATSVIFGPTETSKTFTFTAADDAEDDDGESVKLTFGSALPAGVSRGSVPETTVSINDDDVPSVTVSFGSATYPVDEGETETVTVTLSAAPEREVVVPIDTADEGGASSDDYSLSETSVTFGPTETSKTFTFTAADDAEDDDGESVKLTFGSALPAGVSRGSVPETTVSINDDDVPSVTVSFGSATYPVDEGETETVTVTLSAAPEREVVVPIDTADEGGASSDDYSLSETSVTFGPTETSKTFTFTAADDAEDDDGESVKLTFGSALPAGVSRGSVPETTVSINDDDVPSVTVSFDSATYSATEGGLDAVVTVQLSSPTPHRVEIPITAAGMNGASDDDWMGVPEELIFASGEQSKTFTVMASDDTVEDDGETLELGFGALPAGFVAGNHSAATVELMNMEHTSQDCGTAIWCATVTLAGYENNINGGGDYAEKVANSSLIGDNYFTYNGTTYHVPAVYSVLQHHYFYLSRFVIKLRPYNLPADDYPNWTLYVDGEAFPFTQERMVGGGFRWRHPMFYHFRPGTTFELRIEETATSQARAIDEPPPAPMYLTVLENDSYLSVDWERPPMDEGPDVLFYNETSVPEVTRYRLELKKAGDTWSSAGSSSISYPSSRSAFVNLNNGVEYTMRVFAINQYGESPPSPEVTGTPHEMTPPGLLTATVDGSTLILIYDEALDGAAVPEVDTFTVSVNGSDRVVQSVSIDGSQVKLTLASSVGEGDSVALSYKKPLYMDLPRIQDSVGNAASSIRKKTVTSAPARAVGTRANSPATGAPSVGGTVEVGETLTAETSGIADANGLTNVSYSYQWIANEGNGDMNITGATDSTYTLLATDEGKTIKVSVSFTDDADNGEALISKATGAVAAAPNNRPTGEPTISGTAQVGQLLTAHTSGIADDDGLENVTFSFQWVANDGSTDADISGETDATYTLVADDVGKTIKVKVTFTDDAGNEATLTSVATDEVGFAVQQQGTSNTPATGEPTISGTVQVGETLTADTTGITDDDGLDNVSYTYQWVRNDGNSDTDIVGATDSGYILVADDVGKTIKVEVTVTDDAENETTLTSEATGLSATPSHDRVVLTWDDPNDGTITGYVILRRNREIHPVGTFVTIAGDTGSADATYTDATVEPDKQYVYRIKAINEHGKVSEESDWVRADTPAVPVPDKPTGLTVVVSHDTVTLTWDNPQDDSITGYVILRRDREIHLVGTFVTLTGDTGSADTTYTDDTVEPDKQYVYRIKAINEHGEVSEESDWVRGFTPAAPAPAGSPAQ